MGGLSQLDAPYWGVPRPNYGHVGWLWVQVWAICSVAEKDGAANQSSWLEEYAKGEGSGSGEIQGMPIDFEWITTEKKMCEPQLVGTMGYWNWKKNHGIIEKIKNCKYEYMKEYKISSGPQI